MSKSSQTASPQVTDARRRATLGGLSLVLLATLALVLPSRHEAGADVNAIEALAPVATATAAIDSVPDPVGATTTSTAQAAEIPAAAPEAAVDATTTSTTAAAEAPDDSAGAADETTSTTESSPPPPVSPPPTEAPTTTTTQAPPPPPPPPVSSGDPASIIREVFGGDADAAIVIARCESSLNPSATNPAGYYGLFQIGSGHASRFTSVTGTSWESGRYDARANTMYAKWLFDQSGQTWSQWGCRHRL